MARILAHPARTDYAAVAVIGPVPPPLDGQSLVTERVIGHLARSGVRYTLTNTAMAAAGPPLRRKLRWVVHLVRCGLHALRDIRRAPTIYLAVPGRPRTIFAALYTLPARLAGKRIVLHHNSYSYVTRRTFGMRCLCAVAGRRALHVTQCAAMCRELSAKYPLITNTAALSNVIAVDRDLTTLGTRGGDGALVLGHLSNLTAAKGVLTAIECLAELRSRNTPVELHLAGPVWDSAADRAIRAATGRFGSAFRHHGPVDAGNKRAFFAAIDVFLFPSTYRHETEGIVLLEALAAGVPVIAFGQCCIPSNLTGGCGLVVPHGGDFRAAAVRQILAWHRDRGALRAAAEAARARFAELHRRSLSDLAVLLDFLADGRRECGRRARGDGGAAEDASAKRRLSA